MTDHVYKIVEVVGVSKTSVEEATQNALRRTAKSIRNMRWFQVTEIRGQIQGEEVGQWQVSLKVGFTVED